MIQAVRDGLLGAVRHLLKHDPASMEQKDRRSGGEAQKLVEMHVDAAVLLCLVACGIF